MIKREKALSMLLAGLFSGAVYSQEGPFVANLTGAQEAPAVDSKAQGIAIFRFNQDSTQLTYRLALEQAGAQIAPGGGATPGGAARLVSAHLHCAPSGQAGPVVADLLGTITGGVTGPVEVSATLSDANIIPESTQTTNDQTTCTTTTGSAITTVAQLAQAIAAGNIYVNVSSDQHPDGEIRGQLVSITAGGGTTPAIGGIAPGGGGAAPGGGG